MTEGRYEQLVYFYASINDMWKLLEHPPAQSQAHCACVLLLRPPWHLNPDTSRTEHHTADLGPRGAAVGVDDSNLFGNQYENMVQEL